MTTANKTSYLVLKTVDFYDLEVRLFDLLASGSGLLLLSPLFLFIAILIRLTSHGPIFHRAWRVGKGGQPFQLYKFRSMVVDADKQGPGITSKHDTRITSVGRYLRQTKLDELPQLFNVLKGEMSLVGPRPEDPRYVRWYTPEQERILEVKPGITSAASLHYRNEEQLLNGTDWESTYRHKIMPTKLAIDLTYLAQRTLWSDIKLIFQSIAQMFK